MKTIKLEYCGMAGEGRTVREAKQDATRKIESFLSASHEPVFIKWKGEAVLLWHTPHGIVSSYIHPDTERLSGTCHHGLSSSMDDCVSDAKWNLATITADIESNDCPSIIANDRYRAREYFHWLGFQRAFRHAEAHPEVLNGVDAHRWACDHGEEFNPTRLAVAA